MSVEYRLRWRRNGYANEHVLRLADIEKADETISGIPERENLDYIHVEARYIGQGSTDGPNSSLDIAIARQLDREDEERDYPEAADAPGWDPREELTGDDWTEEDNG